MMAVRLWNLGVFLLYVEKCKNPHEEGFEHETIPSVADKREP